MKYLVTGVAGFIGSKTAEFLLRDGHSVIGIDNLNTYYDVRLKQYRLKGLLTPQSEGGSKLEMRLSGNTAESHGKFTFLPVDVEDRKTLEDLFQQHQFDGVMNLAARAGVRASMENPFIYMTTNAMGTLNLLECMRRFGCRKMVLASTSSLYAGQRMPFTEDLAVNTPLSPYAASKKSAEMLAYSYHKLYDLDISIARYFTVFGPAGRPDMSVFRFIEWMLAEKPIELFGDGTQSRDFTYVDDIARGTINALVPLGYEVVNLGGGRNPISLLEVISYLERFTGKTAYLSRQAFHKADVMETWADIAKAERILQWTPGISVAEGFQRTVTWHFQNRSLLDSLR